MTFLQTPRANAKRAGAPRSAAEIGRDLAIRRPLVLTATVGGAIAALGPLIVCMALAVVGWYLTDAGSHGDPSDALRIGSLSWLVGHGAGIGIEGVRVTALPLGLSLVCVWSIWRVGRKVGESISGHGPDAARIADGERDWTVPLATGLFSAGYVIVATLVCSIAADPVTDPNLTRVVLVSLCFGLLVGGPAVARGSGRAAIWTGAVPLLVREVAGLARRMVVTWFAASSVVFLVALLLDFSTAANIVSQLGAGSGGTVVIVVGCLLLLPNAVLFSSSYLLGPGFTVGTGTLVSPGAVVLGPLPLVPIFAALPDNGLTAGWTSWLIATPFVLAAAVAMLDHHRRPAPGWEQAAWRGCGAGLLSGLVVGVFSSFAGGAIGPGRMRDVGPESFEVFIHALTAFGIGGLLGALAITWWQRKSMDGGLRGLLGQMGRPGRR